MSRAAVSGLPRKGPSTCPAPAGASHHFQKQAERQPATASPPTTRAATVATAKPEPRAAAALAEALEAVSKLTCEKARLAAQLKQQEAALAGAKIYHLTDVEVLKHNLEAQLHTQASNNKQQHAAALTALELQLKQEHGMALREIMLQIQAENEAAIQGQKLLLKKECEAAMQELTLQLKAEHEAAMQGQKLQHQAELHTAHLALLDTASELAAFHQCLAALQCSPAAKRKALAQVNKLHRQHLRQGKSAERPASNNAAAGSQGHSSRLPHRKHQTGSIANARHESAGTASARQTAAASTETVRQPAAAASSNTQQQQKSKKKGEAADTQPEQATQLASPASTYLGNSTALPGMVSRHF